jgi:hypothetical protein
MGLGDQFLRQPGTPEGNLELSKEIAKQEFEAASAPLEQAFGRQREAFEEQLAKRGVQFGGVGDTGRERVLETQNRALAELQGQIMARQMERDFQSREAQLGREFQREQGALARQERQHTQLLGLAKAGQLKGSALDTALSNVGINMEDFLTDSDAELARVAASKGLSLEQAKQAQQLIGDALFADIEANPERYAGLAEDPEEVFRREKAIARASRPKSKGKKHFCTQFYSRDLMSTSELLEMTLFAYKNVFLYGHRAYWYFHNADAIASKLNMLGIDWSQYRSDLQHVLDRVHNVKEASDAYLAFSEKLARKANMEFDSSTWNTGLTSRILGTVKVLTSKEFWKMGVKHFSLIAKKVLKGLQVKEVLA